jgi:hypothetical protein
MFDQGLLLFLRVLGWQTRKRAAKVVPPGTICRSCWGRWRREKQSRRPPMPKLRSWKEGSKLRRKGEAGICDLYIESLDGSGSRS